MESENYISEASKMQLLAAFTASLGACCLGSVLSYTSPAILSMQDEGINSNQTGSSEIKFLDAKDTDLISWIVSIIGIGGLIGSLIAGPICEYVGHRLCICISSFINSSGWLLISLATNSQQVIVGRFLTGFATGVFCTSVPVYVVEISTLSTRSFLGCSFQGFITLGIVFVSVGGMFANWRLLAQLCIIPSMLLAVFIFFFPESPYWLVKKGRRIEALESLKELRTSTSNCERELNEIKQQMGESINDEKSINIKKCKESNSKNKNESSIKIITESYVNLKKVVQNISNDLNGGENVKSYRPSSNKSIENNETTKNSSFIRDLKLPHVYKPLLFGMMIMFFQQVSGSNGLFSSLHMILKSAKLNDLDDQKAALLVNLCFAVFAWLSTYVVNLFGRKTLLMFSSIGYIIAYLTIGSYYLAKEANYDEFAQNYSILPLIGLILFYLVHALGYGSVSWFVIPEMSINYKNQISSICVCLNWIMSFMIMNNFLRLVELINYSGTFLFFALVGLLSAIFVLFIPETKNKTAKQIMIQFYSK